VGGLRVDTVLADPGAVPDAGDLDEYARAIGARLVMSRLASDDSVERHDPRRLAGAFRAALAVPDRIGGRAAWR
jgi:hypothetical protein